MFLAGLKAMPTRSGGLKPTSSTSTATARNRGLNATASSIHGRMSKRSSMVACTDPAVMPLAGRMGRGARPDDSDRALQLVRRDEEAESRTRESEALALRQEPTKDTLSNALTVPSSKHACASPLRAAVSSDRGDRLHAAMSALSPRLAKSYGLPQAFATRGRWQGGPSPTA